ncbi:hypothetical protein Tsubulata_039510 [Turnera subulata]|uniref:DUF4283 domain-containing protein n=1 Tax=Turnera subulata TaxID=218843 RepID=A0A9Q0G0J9_9ROSI|nr:hypothetical protein Tsubulata_039510 [Turnera subulata]
MPPRRCDAFTYPGKTYADTLKQSTTGPSSDREVLTGKAKFTFSPTQETMEWLERSAFGVVINPLARLDIPSLFSEHGYHNIGFSKAGGDSFLIQFPSKHALEEFMADEHEWITQVFSLFRPWKCGDRATNRKCWVQVGGIPFQAWSMEFFKKLVFRIGDLVKIAPATASKENLEFAYLQIFTTVRNQVQWSFTVAMGEEEFEVSLTEVPESQVNSVQKDTATIQVDDLISLTPVEPNRCARRSQEPQVQCRTPANSNSNSSASADCLEKRSTSTNGSDPFQLMHVIEKINRPAATKACLPGKPKWHETINQSECIENIECPTEQLPPRESGAPISEIQLMHEGEHSNKGVATNNHGPVAPYQSSPTAPNETPGLIQDSSPPPSAHAAPLTPNHQKSQPPTPSQSIPTHVTLNNFEPQNLNSPSADQSPSQTPNQSESFQSPIPYHPPIHTSPPSSLLPIDLISKFIDRKIQVALRRKGITHKKKTKAITWTGSVASSIGDTEIKRGNQRFLDSEQLANGEGSFCGGEAEKTCDVGNEIGSEPVSTFTQWWSLEKEFV